jgi:glycosyltransferase involved in cell wall biosynthesis
MVDTSVVVPVYDDPAGVRRTLESLVDQTATDYEVVAVDNGSTDHTPAVIDEFAATDGVREGIRHVSERAIQGSYAARNTGIRAASGEFLLFLDAGTWVRPTYVERATDAMRSGEHDYVGCRVVVPDSGGPVGRFVSATAFPVERYLADDAFAPTCCLGVRRRVVESVGPFDDLLVSGGDVEFGQRVAAAGFDQAYLRDVAVYHPARDSLGALWAKYARVGRGREQLARRHADRFDPHPLWDPRNYLPGPPRQPSSDSQGPTTLTECTVWTALTWLAKLAIGVGRLYERARLGVAAGADGPAGGTQERSDR